MVRIDEMKCPYCGSENVYIDHNTTESEWGQVNVCYGGEYEMECEDCTKHFYVYEETECTQRLVCKEEDYDHLYDDYEEL